MLLYSVWLENKKSFSFNEEGADEVFIKWSTQNSLSQKHSMLSVPHQLQPDQFNNNKATGAGGFETLLVYVLLVSFFQFQSPFVKAMTTFLDASSHLCKSVCPSVRRSVGHAFVMLSWKLHEKALSAQFYHCLSMLFNAFAFSMPFGRIFGLLGLVFKWNQC